MGGQKIFTLEFYYIRDQNFHLRLVDDKWHQEQTNGIHAEVDCTLKVVCIAAMHVGGQNKRKFAHMICIKISHEYYDKNHL